MVQPTCLSLNPVSLTPVTLTVIFGMLVGVICLLLFPRSPHGGAQNQFTFELRYRGWHLKIELSTAWPGVLVMIAGLMLVLVVVMTSQLHPRVGSLFEMPGHPTGTKVVAEESLAPALVPGPGSGASRITDGWATFLSAGRADTWLPWLRIFMSTASSRETAVLSFFADNTPSAFTMFTVPDYIVGVSHAADSLKQPIAPHRHGYAKIGLGSGGDVDSLVDAAVALWARTGEIFRAWNGLIVPDNTELIDTDLGQLVVPAVDEAPRTPAGAGDQAIVFGRTWYPTARLRRAFEEALQILVLAAMASCIFGAGPRGSVRGKAFRGYPEGLAIDRAARSQLLRRCGGAVERYP
jgi:hypothetical protein